MRKEPPNQYYWFVTTPSHEKQFDVAAAARHQAVGITRYAVLHFRAFPVEETLLVCASRDPLSSNWITTCPYTRSYQPSTKLRFAAILNEIKHQLSYLSLDSA